MVDSAPVVIALLDENGRVVLDNHEYKKLMGDLRVREPATLILDSVRADLGPSFGRAEDGGHAFSEHEIRIVAGGGQRWFSCSGIWTERKDDADGFFERRDEMYLLLVAKETTRQRSEQERTRMALLQATMAEENRVDGLLKRSRRRSSSSRGRST